MSDSRVYAYIGEERPLDVAALAEHYAAIERGPRPEFAHQTWRDLCVKRRDTGQAIGTLGTTTIDRKSEVGYTFGADFWGKGYASEALQWYQNWLVRELKATEFWACIKPGNERSIRLVERLGYRPVETESDWPDLRSYDPGDLVFAKRDLDS